MKNLTLIGLLFFTVLMANANDTTKTVKEVEAAPASSDIQYIEEPFILYDYVKINVPAGYRLLDRKSSVYVSEQLLGNEEDKNLLGLLIKESEDSTQKDLLIYVVLNEEGYIKDDDAAKIDKKKILKESQESALAYFKENPYVINKLFFESWGLDPKYDRSTHTLHFAKVLKDLDEGGYLLNYDLFRFNKFGYVKLIVAADTSLLTQIVDDLPGLYDVVSFENNSSYENFDSKTGHVAEWTVGGLVAGKILAKTGILALILKNIKLVLIGIGAAFYAIVKFFKRKKETEVITGNPEDN